MVESYKFWFVFYLIYKLFIYYWFLIIKFLIKYIKIMLCIKLGKVLREYYCDYFIVRFFITFRVVLSFGR